VKRKERGIYEREGARAEEGERDLRIMSSKRNRRGQER
jgi:hypothetical protein